MREESPASVRQMKKAMPRNRPMAMCSNNTGILQGRPNHLPAMVSVCVCVLPDEGEASVGLSVGLECLHYVSHWFVLPHLHTEHSGEDCDAAQQAGGEGERYIYTYTGGGGGEVHIYIHWGGGCTHTSRWYLHNPHMTDT